MNKLKAAICCILDGSPDQKLEILRLAKFLYLCDYVYAKTFGNKHAFTGLYTRFEWGPVPHKFYDALEELYSADILKRHGNVIALTRTNAKPEKIINHKEMACIKKVLFDFAPKSTGALLKIAYATEPMQHLISREQAIGNKMLFEKVPFECIERHPLMDIDEVDVSFMDTKEFKQSLDDE